MKILIWFPLLLIFSSLDKPKPRVSLGSTAICLGTKNYILIAADSKVVLLDRGSNKYKDYGRTCKVHQYNNLIYAEVGILKMTNPDIDPVRIISKIEFKEKRFRSIIHEIRYAVRDSLLLMAQTMSIENAAFFSDNILNKNFVTFAFGSFDAGRAVVGFWRIWCKKDKNNNVFLTDTVTVCDSLPTIFQIGRTEAIDSVLKQEPHYFAKYKDIFMALNDLIKLQSLKTPEEVNDVVNIIGMDSTGIHWYQRNQECF